MVRLADSASLFLSSVGITLIAVCIGTNNWVSRVRPKYEAREGLFYRCSRNVHTDGVVDESCQKIYNDFKDFPAIYIAIVSLMFAACLVQIINFLLSIFCCCMGWSPTKVICTLEILTIMSAIGGLSTYVRFYNNKYYKLDWSYIVGWVGVCFISIGLVFVIVGIERRKHLHHWS